MLFYILIATLNGINKNRNFAVNNGNIFSSPFFKRTIKLNLKIVAIPEYLQTITNICVAKRVTPNSYCTVTRIIQKSQNYISVGMQSSKINGCKMKILDVYEVYRNENYLRKRAISFCGWALPLNRLFYLLIEKIVSFSTYELIKPLFLLGPILPRKNYFLVARRIFKIFACRDFFLARS